ncbi:MAG TPA: tetratricopeptide repeat protein [Chthoniobacterales bacterium]
MFATSALLRFAVGPYLLLVVLCINAHPAGSSEDEANISALHAKSRQLREAGKFADGLPIARKSLELSKRALGSEHPGTARSLKNLAMLYSSTGDYLAAEPLYQRALKIREKAVGPIIPTLQRHSAACRGFSKTWVITRTPNRLRNVPFYPHATRAAATPKQVKG